MDYSSEARIKMMERQAAASKPAVSAYVQQRMAYQQTPPENRRPDVAQLRQFIATPEAEKDFYKWVRSAYGFATSQRDLDNGYLDPSTEMVAKALSQYAYNRQRVSKQGKNELKYGTLDYDPWDKDEADNEDWGAFYRDYERTPSETEFQALRNQRAAKLQGVDSMSPSTAAWNWKDQYTYDQNDANDRARQKLAKAGYNVMPKSLLAEYTNEPEDQQRKQAGLPPRKIERTQTLISQIQQYTAAVKQMAAGGTYTPEAARSLLAQYPELNAANQLASTSPASSNPEDYYRGESDKLAKYYRVDALKPYGYDTQRGFGALLGNAGPTDPQSAATRDASQINAIATTQGWQSAMAQRAADSEGQPQELPTGGTMTKFERGADGRLHPVATTESQQPGELAGGLSALQGNEPTAPTQQDFEQVSQKYGALAPILNLMNIGREATKPATDAVGLTTLEGAEAFNRVYEPTAAAMASAGNAATFGVPAIMMRTSQAQGLDQAGITERFDELRAQNPGASIAGDIGGSIVSGAALEGAAVNLLGKAFPQITSTLLKGAIAGGGAGGIQNALLSIGEGSDAGQVAQDFLYGLAMGSAGDAGIRMLGDVIQGLPKPGSPAWNRMLQSGELIQRLRPASSSLARTLTELNTMEADQAAGVAQREAAEVATNQAAIEAAQAPAVTVQRGMPQPVVRPPDFTVTLEGQALRPGQQAPLALPAGAADAPAKPIMPRPKIEAPMQILPKELKALKKQGIVPQTTKLSDVNAAAAEAQRAAGRVANDATANTLRNPLLPKPVQPTAYPSAGSAWGNMPVPRALRDATTGKTMSRPRALGTPMQTTTGGPAASGSAMPTPKLLQTGGTLTDAYGLKPSAASAPRNVAQGADNIVDELTLDPRAEARAAKAQAFAEQPGGNMESAARKISYDVARPRPKSIGSAFDFARSKLVDKYAHIERAEKTILGKVQGADTSAYKQARLYAGVPERANLIIQKELNPIIKAVEKTGKSYKDLGLYSLAVHAKDVNAAGMVSGFTNAEIDDVIRKLGTPDMEQARRALVDYSNRRLDTLVDSGRISQEAVDAMRDKWQNYIPLSRALDETDTGFMRGLSDSFAGVAQPIKGLQGSERNVIDPIESLMRNTYVLENAAGRSEVAKRFGMLADADGEHRFFRKLTDQEAEGKSNIIKVYENGKEVKYETTKEIFDEVAGMNQEQSNVVIKILSAPASVLRAGATLSPEFAIRNPIRDVMNAWVVSDGFNPITDFPRGLASAIRKDELYEGFIKDKGGFGNLLSRDRAAYRSAIEDAIRQPVTKRFVTVLNPKTWLEGLRAVSDATETATKVGVYRAGLRKGMTPAEAAYQARDTMDFARVGSSTQPFNQIVAFLNSNIQGKSKLIRAIQERPVKTMAKIATGMTLPSVGAFFWNDMVANDEQKRTIDDAPTWLRDSFWLMAIPGTNLVARIPKPFDLAVFANTTERFLDYAVNKDPKAFDGFRGDILKQQALPVMPTGLLPLVEGMTNYSFFRQGPIVPQREEGMPTAEQYDSGTSETAKGFAAAARAATGGERSTNRLGSPRVMDYAIRSSTGGLGGYALDAIDVLLESVGLAPNKNRTAKNTSELPIAKAFLVKEGSAGQSMDFVYTERDAMTRERNSFRKQNPEAQYPDEAKYRYISAAADAVGELSAQVRDIENSPTMDPKVKRDEINSLNGQRNAITQAAKEQYESAADMAADGVPVVLPFVLTGSNPNTNVEKTMVLTPEQQGRYQQELQQRVSAELERLRPTLALKPAAIRQKTIGDTIEKIRTAMKNEILWGR